MKEVAVRRSRPEGRIAAGARLRLADDKYDHRSTINRLPQRRQQTQPGFGGTSAPAAAPEAAERAAKRCHVPERRAERRVSAARRP